MPRISLPTDASKALLIALVAALLATLPVVADEGDPVGIFEEIVNGLTTQDFPTVVQVGKSRGFDGLRSNCSGTLIGCRTVLTAAHCVCPAGATGSTCSPTPSLYRVYGQHIGIFDVSSISVHPDFDDFAAASDIAILKLQDDVAGVQPSRVNDMQPTSLGQAGTIVGYGATDEEFNESNGIKRYGDISIAACSSVPDQEHVCWNFVEPVGEPGDDSNTCFGDSGGPLFVNFPGDGEVVAGVTSGGSNPDCIAPDNSYDADVFESLSFITQAGGSDIQATSCGNLPQVGEDGVDVLARAGDLSFLHSLQTYEFMVPQGTGEVRITTNAQDDNVNNNFVVAAAPGTEVPDFFFGSDCVSAAEGTYQACSVTSPETGTWTAAVGLLGGPGGTYQMTATTFESGGGGGGGGGGGNTDPCVASSTVACLVGDRFEVKVDWETLQGTGVGSVGGLDLDEGEVFSFFNPENPEMLVKVKDACLLFNHFWVFMAATTDVEFTLTVRDTETGEVNTYFNPQGTPAAPVQDTTAFSTCP